VKTKGISYLLSVAGAVFMFYMASVSEDWLNKAFLTLGVLFTVVASELYHAIAQKHDGVEIARYAIPVSDLLKFLDDEVEKQEEDKDDSQGGEK